MRGKKLSKWLVCILACLWLVACSEGGSDPGTDPLPGDGDDTGGSIISYSDGDTDTDSDSDSDSDSDGDGDADTSADVDTSFEVDTGTGIDLDEVVMTCDTDGEPQQCNPQQDAYYGSCDDNLGWAFDNDLRKCVEMTGCPGNGCFYSSLYTCTAGCTGTFWNRADVYDPSVHEYCNPSRNIGIGFNWPGLASDSCLNDGLYWCVDASLQETLTGFFPHRPDQIDCDLPEPEASHCADLGVEIDNILDNDLGWSWERNRLQQVRLEGTITCRADLQFASSLDKKEYCQLTLIPGVEAVHCGNTPLTTKIEF